jgi:hypothetical protein
VNPATGAPFISRGKWYARATVAKKRECFAMPWCAVENREAAKQRAALVAKAATGLATAHGCGAVAKRLLQDLASCESDDRLHAQLAAIQSTEAAPRTHPMKSEPMPPRLCLDRHRLRDIKRKYGLEREDYERMMFAQGNRCAICGVQQDRLKRSLAVDHCHNTGKVRGLLCGNCNSGIGKLADNPAMLIKAAAYLTHSY